jgi:hypothetical protein
MNTRPYHISRPGALAVYVSGRAGATNALGFAVWRLGLLEQ